MSFTKKDREEIAKIIKEVLANDEKAEHREKLPDFEKWKEQAIKLDCGITLAPEDFFVGDKKFFTWDEAMEYEKEVLRPNGWRLPTSKEWAILYGHYGINEKTGEDDAEGFMGTLKLGLNGYICDDDMDRHNEDNELFGLIDQGSYGHYWSSTAYSTATLAYHLAFDTSAIRPQATSARATASQYAALLSRSLFLFVPPSE